MDKNLYTGNSLLDKIIQGPYVSNPEYNPKTKKGKKQPQFLLDTSAGDTGGGAYSNTVQGMKRIQFTTTDYGRDLESIKRDEDLGITFSPYNSDDELNTARANAQGAMTQFGNFLMQAGVGEIVLGTLEGFGNIVDGIANTFTDTGYEANPYTQYMHELKEEFNKNFEIYQKNPDESFQFNDFGWWMQNAVSAASTLSLMLPAAGWLKAAGMTGKLTGLSKLGNWSVRAASKGLAKAATKAADSGAISGLFPAVKSVAGKAGRIEQGLRGSAEIIGQATLSRAGEGYMEARSVYETVSKDSLDNLNGMNDTEFAEFLKNNPEFINEDGTAMSKEDIAKQIAKKSADKTLMNDYWMLGMDIMQFKALGSLFGGRVKRSPSASERIAAENVKRTMAGKTEKELLKDTFLNRQKVKLKYAAKEPLNSLTALELGEGFEEFYQGVQSEKGLEVATKYFDKDFTPRTLSSYLTDSSMWEQFFWGSLAAVGFNKAYKGVQGAGHTIEGMYKKKHMIPEDYERWKRSEDKVRVEQINNTIERTNELINNLQQLNKGINPFNFTIDERNGRVILKNGQVQNENITDTQKNLLKQQAISKFTDEVAMNATDNGTFDLMTEILGGSEFDKYISDKGLQITGEDKALSQQVVDRMKTVNGIYNNELNNVAQMADTTNPYITIAAARDVTKHKLMSEELALQADRIGIQLAEANDTQTDYTAYTEKAIYNAVHRQINSLDKQLANIQKEYDDGNIGRSAFEQYEKLINKDKKTLLEYASSNTTQGAFDAVRQSLKEADNTEQTIAEFDKFIREYNAQSQENVNIPTATIRDLIDEQIGVNLKSAYNNATIPTNQQEYQDVYNEFGTSMDKMLINRTNDYIDIIKNYIRNSKNIDEAIERVYAENTGNKKVDEALHFLKFGYQVQDPNKAKGQNLINLQLELLINKAKEEREADNKRQEDADKLGVELPQTEEEQIEDGLSTGEETQQEQQIQDNTADINDEVAEINTNPAQQKPTETPINTGVQITPDDAPIVDKTLPVENPDKETELTEQQKKEAAAIAEGYETPNLKASLDAGRYVMQVGFTKPHIFEEITEAKSRGDNSKEEAFIKEVTDFLVSRGYGEAFAKIIAEQSFRSTVNSFAAMKTKPVFNRLAEQLAMGVNETSAKKYSATELADGKGLNEIVNEFLTKYAEEVGNTEIGGKYVINLESLFDFIINNKSIDKQTAAAIYDNLGKYLTKNDESKYIFTGFNSSKPIPNSKDFFDRINEEKSQIKATMNDVHIHLTEERDKYFDKALEAVANGAPAFIKPEGSLQRVNEKGLNMPLLDEKGNNVPTSLGIYVRLGKGKKERVVKIGILRTVEMNATGDSFSPYSHYSGFANKMNISGDEITMDCDILFNKLIDRDSESAIQLYTDLAEYTIKLKQLAERLNNSKLTSEEWVKQYRKGRSEIMTQELARRILGNEHIENLLNKKIYQFYNKEATEIEQAETIATAIANILFYDQHFAGIDGVNSVKNTLAFDKNSMQERYDEWKEKIRVNYTKTYELQKALSEQQKERDRKTGKKKEGTSTAEVSINLNVGYFTAPNIISNPENYVNVEEADFELDPESKSKVRPYTPLVMVKNHKLINEKGEELGYTDMQDYSIGYLVHNEDGVQHVAYCINTEQIKGSALESDVKKEILSLIQKQLSNLDVKNHSDNFNNIKTRILELFGTGGLLKLNNIRIAMNTNKDNASIITIQEVLKDGKTRNLLTFFEESKDGSKSHAIGIYDAKSNSMVTTNNVEGYIGSKNYRITKEQYNQNLKQVIDTILNGAVLNRSSMAMNATESNKIVRRENGKFIINLGGKDTTYNNYGDFIVQNRGFKTNMKRTNGEFVTRYIDEKHVTIDGKSRDTTNDVQVENNNVTDLVNKTRSADKKKIKTVDLLEAAGVPQEKIDILMGTKSGIQLANKEVYLSDLDDGTTNAFYDGKVNITNRGAASMNGAPTNAIRLILHENIHRLFVQNKQKERIIKELTELFEYATKKLEEDFNNGIITENRYNEIKKVFDVVTGYKDPKIIAEEFLAESLTQPAIVKYFNETLYHSEAIIDGIPQKSKTIFQKIIDFLLKLFDKHLDNIKNNSILAREYIILSNSKTPTDGGLFKKPISAETAKKDNVQSPVEKQVDKSQPNNTILANTKKKIDEIRDNFEKRIVRSENFAEDHIYYIDDKPADTSVTQQIHGKQDLEEWGTPASTLGNTFDEAARLYFDKQYSNFDDVNVPNATHEEDLGLGAEDSNSQLALKEDLDRLKEYLDNRFGKGKYGVITEEFPIGGVVVVNGKEKTIAGTMDMIVYTDTGDIYIFDFKTKRKYTQEEIKEKDRKGEYNAEEDGNISENTLIGYNQQVNIYRQLIESNFPELKGKVHTGSLIKANPIYPNPKFKKNHTYEYRKSPDNDAQLQISVDGGKFENIQDAAVEYSIPRLPKDLNDKKNIIPVEEKDYTYEIKSLPEQDKTAKQDIAGSEMFRNEDDELNALLADFNNEESDMDYGDTGEEVTPLAAKSELAEIDENKTPAEIYAPAVTDGITDNTYGVRIVNDMNEFIDSFPIRYRNNIQQILASNELNFACR